MLHHLSCKKVAQAGVFKGLASYDQMISAIVAYGNTLDKAENEYCEIPDEHGLTERRKEYNYKVGAAFEVYTEYFMSRYGQRSNPALGVLHIKHTSQNEFQEGYDFTYKTFEDKDGRLQSKFRSNAEAKFGIKDFGTFAFMLLAEKISTDHAIWFSNLICTDKTYRLPSGICIGNVCRNFDRKYQEIFIDRDPDFWKNLELSIGISGQKRTNFIAPYTPRIYQQRMIDAGKAVEERGRIICATGGGKTLVEYYLIRDGFKTGNQLQVIVAPTIDLLTQHHQYFEDFGMFHESDIAVFHFRTGDDARQDDWIDYEQSTKSDVFLEALMSNKPLLVFVTFASEQRMFELAISADRVVDLAIWDEFHHCVRNKRDYREHMESLPCAKNLFFSASQKHSRVMSTTQEHIFGPVICDIDYKELRALGVLVPKIIVKPLHINPEGKKLKGILREFNKAAVRDNFDARTAVSEAAGTIVAHKNLMKWEQKANIVTFSKRVAICKAIVESNAVSKELPITLLNTVHSRVMSRDRRAIYDQVKESSDSVLCQYSVVKEGIDITPFNGAVFSRNMDEIGIQQGLGRILRADPQDTANLTAKIINLDVKAGWNKYSATVYIILHDEDMLDFKDRIKDLIKKLQHAGLSDDDYQFEDIIDERHGKDNDLDGWITKLPVDNTILIDAPTLKSYISLIQCEIEEELLEDQESDEQLKLREDLREKAPMDRLMMFRELVRN